MKLIAYFFSQMIDIWLLFTMFYPFLSVIFHTISQVSSHFKYELLKFQFYNYISQEIQKNINSLNALFKLYLCLCNSKVWIFLLYVVCWCFFTYLNSREKMYGTIIQQLTVQLQEKNKDISWERRLKRYWLEKKFWSIFNLEF